MDPETLEYYSEVEEVHSKTLSNTCMEEDTSDAPQTEALYNVAPQQPDLKGGKPCRKCDSLPVKGNYGFCGKCRPIKGKPKEVCLDEGPGVTLLPGGVKEVISDLKQQFGQTRWKQAQRRPCDKQTLENEQKPLEKASLNLACLGEHYNVRGLKYRTLPDPDDNEADGDPFGYSFRIPVMEVLDALDTRQDADQKKAQMEKKKAREKKVKDAFLRKKNDYVIVLHELEGMFKKKAEALMKNGKTASALMQEDLFLACVKEKRQLQHATKNFYFCGKPACACRGVGLAITGPVHICAAKQHKQGWTVWHSN